SAVRGCQRADSKGERHVSAETVAARSSHRLAPLQRMQVFVTLARPAGAERVRLSVAYADVAELAFGHLAQQAAIVGGFLSSCNESVQARRRAFEDPRRVMQKRAESEQRGGCVMLWNVRAHRFSPNEVRRRPGDWRTGASVEGDGRALPRESRSLKQCGVHGSLRRGY